jgi:CubicO group peptidase (beta-lactamase class C family)
MVLSLFSTMTSAGVDAVDLRLRPYWQAVKSFLLCLLLASPAVAACHETQFVTRVPITTCTAAEPRFAGIRAELIEAVRKGEIPSASVTVIADGKTVWEESIGWADREKKIPATAATAYLLASMGKSVSATAVMNLVEQGAIDLDAPVSRYLGDVKLTMYAGNEEAVTVTRVLDMTAEIPHGGLSFKSLAARNAYSTAVLVRNRGFVVFPPGTISLYSNMNYAVVEQMIEHVTGKPYGTFLHDALFAPLGMEHTWVGTRARGAAIGYGRDGKALGTTFNIPESSLSMYASIDDLRRYARLHLGLLETPLLSHESLTRMHTHRSGLEHAPMALGIGRIELDGGQLFLLTNGRAGGAQSALGMLPDQRSAAICLINATGNRADDVVFRITDILSPRFLDQFHKRLADYEAWAERPFQATPEMLGEWRGTIVTTRAKLPIRLLFQPDGDIHVQIADQPETLVKLAYDDGLLSGTLLAEVPAEESAGHAHDVRLALLQNGTRLSGYVVSSFNNERGAFSLPSYVALEKVKP